MKPGSAPIENLKTFTDPYIFPGWGVHLIELCTIRMSVGHIALDVSIPLEQGLRITTVVSQKKPKHQPETNHESSSLGVLSRNHQFSIQFLPLANLGGGKWVVCPTRYQWVGRTPNGVETTEMHPILIVPVSQTELTLAKGSNFDEFE